MQKTKPKKVRATRIDEDDAAFKWIVPAALIALSAITIFMAIASVAVLFGWV